MIHIDSSFVIDLLREQRRRQPGPASRWVASHGDEPLAASVFVWCELESGAAAADRPEEQQKALRDFVNAVTLVFPDERFAPEYGATLDRMQRRGATIGTMDLLIATTALVAGAPILTANVRHFDAVPGLRVLPYR